MFFFDKFKLILGQRNHYKISYGLNLENTVFHQSSWFLYGDPSFPDLRITILFHQKVWFVILAIPLSILNGFGGQFLNAWFLNKYGVESTAIITSDEETNSTLNDMYIHDYEAIVKKQDGKYISTYFSTTSATIYPIENAIRIPRMEISFP